VASRQQGATPQQDSHFLSGFKRSMSAIAVDTITTRFLLLFIFLLIIPLVTVALFSFSLLANHMDETTNTQVALSESLFEGALSHYAENLTLFDTEVQELSAKGQEASRPHCPKNQTMLCLLADYHAGQTYFEDGISMPLATLAGQSPDLAAAFRKPLSTNPFYARRVGQLFLFSKSILGNPDTAEVFRGYAIDDQLLRLIYQQYPGLKTETWVLREPLTAKQAVWFARSPESPYRIPVESVLTNLQDPRENPTMTLELENQGYQILQKTIYSLNHEPIARVIHILPLARNQMLLKNYYMGIYIIAVSSLVFSILLAMGAGRTITQPLLKLISQVNTLSRENVMRETDEVSVAGVHEIKQLGEAFNRMVKRLRQEHKMKDEFVATLTHDLKVPMLAEKQTLSYFRKGTYGPLTTEQEEVLGILHSSNRSCLDLVNGLLEVYRYDSGEVSLVFETFNLLDLLQETVGELQSLAQEKAITLEVSSPLSLEPNAPNDDALVYADRLEIKRVLHNLVSNAVINTPVHGTIRCTVTDAAHHGSDTVYKVGGLQYTTLKHPVKLSERLLVTVQDSGIGFSHEDLPNLFKQFAASKGRNPMSIGLGLYNCHQVVHAHNGVLWVESTEGEGSLVSFVLPTNKQTAQDRRVYRDRRKHV
jgi:signal transduction histidine kinase